MDQELFDQRVQHFYSQGWSEATRLEDLTPAGAVEFIRVQELVRSQLPRASRVIDIGGATGIHARWLAEDGHRVTLVDPVAAQVAEARKVGTFEAVVGDARRLDRGDDEFDAALVFGPLYHLVHRDDRVAALREARRVVRPGGLVMASAIGRLAAAAYGITSPFWDRGTEGLEELVRDGSPLADTAGFPGAHFHTCAELESEMVEAGLIDVTSVGVEGFGVGVEYLSGADSELADAMLTLARRLAEVPGAKDTSGHLMATGRTPAS